MKKLSLALVAVTVLTLAPATAFAKEDGKVSSILFTCNMDFRATGKSVYVGLGWSDIKGKGTISCYDLIHGTTELLPIRVKAKGPGAGLGVTGLILSGAVAGVGVERGPQDLIGRYVAIRGNAAVGVGAGGAVGLRVSKGGITVPVSVQAQSGLGAGIDLLWLKIESDGDPRTEPAAPPVATTTSATAATTAATSADASADDDDDADSATSVAATSAASAATEVAAAPAPAPAPSVSAPASAASAAKANVVYLQEGQPLEILDGKGRVVQTIYLKRK